MTMPSRAIDVCGGVVSLLCILHCLLFPVVGALSTIYGFSLFVEEKQIAVAFVFLALTVGIFAFGSGYLRHRKVSPLLFSVTGIALIAAATQLSEGGLSAFAEPGLTIMGGVLLINAHVINRRNCICPREVAEESEETVG